MIKHIRERRKRNTIVVIYFLFLLFLFPLLLQQCSFCSWTFLSFQFRWWCSRCGPVKSPRADKKPVIDILIVIDYISSENLRCVREVDIDLRSLLCEYRLCRWWEEGRKWGWPLMWERRNEVCFWGQHRFPRWRRGLHKWESKNAIHAHTFWWWRASSIPFLNGICDFWRNIDDVMKRWSWDWKNCVVFLPNLSRLTLFHSLIECALDIWRGIPWRPW